MTKTASGSVRAPRVDMVDFITACEQSDSHQEVANKTGMELNSVAARISKYRGLGIAIKNFPRGGGPKLDLDAATALIAKLRGVNVETVKAAGEALVAKVAERAANRADG